MWRRREKTGTALYLDSRRGRWMPFQMRFRMLSTLLLSLIVPAGSASADMRFNFENCYKS